MSGKKPLPQVLGLPASQMDLLGAGQWGRHLAFSYYHYWLHSVGRGCSTCLISSITLPSAAVSKADHVVFYNKTQEPGLPFAVF